MARGNGKIFFDAPNRGSKRLLSFLNDAPATNDPSTIADAGNGFLMRQGYTIVWCGWQGDLMPIKNWLVLDVPVATNRGKPIVSKVRTEIVVDEKNVKSQPLSADERVKSYEAAIARQVTSDAHRAREILRQKNSRAGDELGIRRFGKRSKHAAKKPSNQAPKISTCTRDSNPATSMNSSTRRKILLCWAWASPSRAI